MKYMKYYVQETVGGWKQVPVFEGSRAACYDYLASRRSNGSYSVVSYRDLQIDYLED